MNERNHDDSPQDSSKRDRPLIKYMSVDDLFVSSEPSNSFRQAREAYIKEHCSHLIDPITHRQMEDWSYLNSLVVGAEGIRK